MGRNEERFIDCAVLLLLLLLWLSFDEVIFVVLPATGSGLDFATSTKKKNLLLFHCMQMKKKKE